MATTIATMSIAAIGAAPKLQHLSMLSTHPQVNVHPQQPFLHSEFSFVLGPRNPLSC